jgi:hypothetical protein
MRKQSKDLETAQAVERATQSQDDTTITLSSGVVLRGRRANPLVLIQVMAAKPRPEPPLVYIQAMGREMENPDDPDYIDRLRSWQMEYADRMVTAMILLGTELVSVPKGLSSPDKNDWLEEYALLALPTSPENKSWRYLTWLKFRAVKNENDMKVIQDVVGRLSGVRESAVQSAEDFPGSNQADR